MGRRCCAHCNIWYDWDETVVRDGKPYCVYCIEDQERKWAEEREFHDRMEHERRVTYG